MKLTDIPERVLPEQPRRACLPPRIKSVIAFARENFLNDGAEGESVWLLCEEVERLHALLQGVPEKPSLEQEVSELRAELKELGLAMVSSLSKLSLLVPKLAPRGKKAGK